MENKDKKETAVQDEDVIVVDKIEGSSMKEESPQEKYHAFKAFSRISSLIYVFITTILMGIVLGYFFNKWFEGDSYMLIMIILFTAVASFNLYRGLLRIK